MTNTIDNLKFDISENTQAHNAATSLMMSGFVPAGPAAKNGWEEVRSVTDNIKLGIAGLYSTVMETARDIINLGCNNAPIVIDVYKTVPSDLQITLNSLQEIDKRFATKKGFFKNPDDALKAQQVILDYTAVFDKVRVLTSSIMVELQDVLMNLAAKAKQTQDDLTNPNVVSDVEIKTV